MSGIRRSLLMLPTRHMRRIGQGSLNDHTPSIQALLAPSACNLSRSSRKSEPGPSSLQVTYRPRWEYLLSSQHYYGSSIKQIARSIDRNTSCSPSYTLAVLVCFVIWSPQWALCGLLLPCSRYQHVHHKKFHSNIVRSTRS